MKTRYVLATLSSGLLLAGIATAGDTPSADPVASPANPSSNSASSPSAGKRTLRDLDTNADGKLSATEATGGGVTQTEFASADANKDGALDSSEFARWQSMKDLGGSK